MCVHRGLNDKNDDERSGNMPSATYSHAVHRANVWIADLARSLETDDRRLARRVMRAWLHVLRDRLTIDAAVKFGQQLPELIRGEYYDGWEPSRAPMRYDPADYVERFSVAALISAEDVPATAATVTEVVTEHMSPGQVDAALAELPADLRALVVEGVPPHEFATHRPTARPATLDERVSTLSEAVHTLARGLTEEHAAGTRIDQAQIARAARLAEDLLLAAQR
jgi:uncharacterized protein (DUF2267 family)